MNGVIKKMYQSLGLPRIIIISLFLAFLIAALVLQLDFLNLLGNVLRRWGQYGLLALALVPTVRCGIGLNFGISLGIVSGLLGATFVIQIGVADPFTAFVFAALVGGAVAWLFGSGYGVVLNRVKGSEMTVSTYVGFSVIALMNIVWLSLPYTHGELIWPIGQQGLRNTINLESSFGEVLNDFAAFSIGGDLEAGTGLIVPTGMLLCLGVMCLIVWLFLRSKTGMAMSAAGSNPMFAKANGINVNRMRILGTAISTALAAIGIIVYSQSFGFLQLYNAPLWMGFQSAAAVLIGGATLKKANISHALLGTLLFQGILAVALPVINAILPESNLPDVIRIIISNGIIIYALTKTKGGKDSV